VKGRQAGWRRQAFKDVHPTAESAKAGTDWSAPPRREETRTNIQTNLGVPFTPGYKLTLAGHELLSGAQERRAELTTAPPHLEREAVGLSS
jgi:hypothetical protein